MSDEFSTDNPLLDQFAKTLMEATKGGIHTIIPAEIVSYDPDKQTAEVQITVRSRRLDKSTEESVSYLPKPIANVPVQFPSAAGFSFTWPLAPRDKVTLLVADRSISEWKATGQQDNDPIIKHRFNLSDAICLPGLISPADPLTKAYSDKVYINSTHPFIIDCHDIRLSGPNPTDFVALSDKVDRFANAIYHAVLAHVHPANATPATFPIVPVEPLTPIELALLTAGADSASAYVKAD